MNLKNKKKLPFLLESASLNLGLGLLSSHYQGLTLNNKFKSSLPFLVRCFSSIGFVRPLGVIPFSSMVRPSNLNNKFKTILMKYNDFTENNFVNSLVGNLYLNSSYSLLVVASYDYSYKSYSLSRQRGIYILDKHDINYYRSIYYIILEDIEDLLLKYDLTNYPNLVLLRYKQTFPSKELLILRNSSGTSGNSFIANNKQISSPMAMDSKTLNSTKLKLFSKYLPFSLNLSLFFPSIELDLKSKYLEGLINHLKLSDRFNSSIFSIINNMEICKVFLPLGGKASSDSQKKKTIRPLIIELNFRNISELSSLVSLDKFHPIIKSLSSQSNYSLYYRLVYDLNSGLLLRELVDISIAGSNTLIRVIGNSYLSIDLSINKLKMYSQFKLLDAIKQPVWKYPPKNRPNPNFGVLDVETYKEGNISKVYALGFATLLEKDKINTFFLRDLFPSINSNLLIINCINSILISKYNNYIFYIHNMGNFDIVFIYKALKEYNLNYGSDYYILNSIFRSNSMLKLTVKIKADNGKIIKVTFVDSYNILSQSLHKLSKDFGVNTVKSHFPHDFANRYTFNYEGETPDKKFYPDLSLEEYNLYYLKRNWNFMAECKKYLESDIKSLLEVIEKFNYSLFVDHNLQMSEGLTISRLALNKWLFYYMKNSKIPLINNFDHFNFINFGYYGGRTEVFIPFGTNLNYFDVNSIYPFVAQKPMPGCEVNYLETLNEEGLNLEELFGFFIAQVESGPNNKYLGLLPVKTSSGLSFPIGKYSGVWSSEELKYAKSNGYKVKVLRGYNFNKVENVFTEYVGDLYERKLNSFGSEKAVNKSLLNNLIGRFGLNIIKPVTKSLNSDKLNQILSTREVFSLEEVTKNDFLITYNPIIKEEICLEHGLDYIKVLEKERNYKLDKELSFYQDVSIAPAAMITSYGRIEMAVFLLLIIKNGGKIFYIDTDSVVTDLDLSTIFPELVGKEIGKFKHEYKIKEGYFISNKTYCLVLEDGTSVIKAKGVNQNSLTVNDFKDMLVDNKNISALRKNTTKNWSEGFVNIENKEISLSPSSYTKRIKILNNEGIWIDTKPFFIDTLTKSITIYKEDISPKSIVIYKGASSTLLTKDSIFVENK
jgi:hypothetical protein